MFKITVPKVMANAAAEISGTNSRVGKTYPRVCKTSLCYPEYVCDQVEQCVKCKKLRA